MPKSEPVPRPDRERTATSPASSTARAEATAPPAPAARVQRTPASLMWLQHTAGNRAVQRLVNSAAASTPPVQRIDDDEAHAYTPYQPIAAAPASAPSAAPPPAAAAPAADAGAAAGYGAYVAHDAPADGGAAAGYGAYVPAGADAPAAPEPSVAGAGVGPGGLAPIALPAKYRGEDREVGWRATYGMPENASAEVRARAEAVSHGTSLVTKYNTPEETAANTLTPRANEAGGASLTDAGGAVASTGKVEYAMSPQGQVVANLGGAANEKVPGQTRNIHHSTMFAGADVAHAGHIGVTGGQVNYLDDDSGHYRPDEAHTYAAFNELADQGVLNKDSAVGRVKLVDKTKQKGLGQGESASVHFSGYQQAQGNEQAIRNRSAVMDELLSKRPRYEGPSRPDEPSAAGAMVYEPDAPAPAPTPAPTPSPAASPMSNGMAGSASSVGGPVMGATPDPSAAAAMASPYQPYSPYQPMPADPSMSTPAATPGAPATPSGYAPFLGGTPAPGAPPAAASGGYAPFLGGTPTSGAPPAAASGGYAPFLGGTPAPGAPPAAASDGYAPFLDE